MNRIRIGELLSRLVPLSGHDVEEILQEQHGTHRRFGDIALSWGLCKPAHVWTAWYTQLDDHLQYIDLPSFGVDTQAIAAVPREVAIQHGLIPVRILDEQLIVAIGDELQRLCAADAFRRLSKDVRFVLADPGHVQAAIDDYYGAIKVSA